MVATSASSHYVSTGTTSPYHTPPSQRKTRIPSPATTRVTTAARQPPADPLERFQNNVSRFTRTNDRRMMVRMLSTSPLLRFMPLPPLRADSNDWKALEQQIGSDPVYINGQFLGGHARSNQVLKVLRKLCAAFGTEHRLDAEDLYYQLLLRVDRRSDASAALHQVSAMLGTDLTIQLPKKASPSPTDLTLYVDAGHVHARSTNRHPLGVFRPSDLAAASPRTHIGLPSAGKRPWVRLLVTVTERVNLTTGDAVRYCSVVVQEK